MRDQRHIPVFGTRPPRPACQLWFTAPRKTNLARPNSRLTFVSEGVVEATNGKRELFGFERTKAISSQPAKAIAEAAKDFGQEDDISIVTITRLAIEPVADTELAAVV
jgi:hypothetical protein